MTDVLNRTSMTRRSLLKQSVALGVTFAVGGSFVAANNAAWALEVKHLKPSTMATLIQMARDIYPHDHVGDEYYVTAVKGYDDAKKAASVEEGISSLNAAARKKGFKSYLDMGWERDRVDVLRSLEKSKFFQTVRGGLITGLYNQKTVWSLFGYEGESYSKGGYIDRGFDDINWL